MWAHYFKIRFQTKASSLRLFLTWITLVSSDCTLTVTPNKKPYSCPLWWLFRGMLFLKTFAPPSCTEILQSFSLSEVFIVKVLWADDLFATKQLASVKRWICRLVTPRKHLTRLYCFPIWWFADPHCCVRVMLNYSQISTFPQWICLAVENVSFSVCSVN